MNAGKSTALLQVAHNDAERGMVVLLFTAAHDDCAGAGQIGACLGLVRRAATFGAHTAFDRARLQALAGGPPACVLIDEAQFLTPAQVRQLHRMAHVDNVPVVCWGLRSDFQGEAFAGAATLLTPADEVEEMKSTCACAGKATMDIRIDGEGRRVQRGAQVMIGGNERDRALCPAGFYSDDTSAPVAPGLFGERTLRAAGG